MCDASWNEVSRIDSYKKAPMEYIGAFASSEGFESLSVHCLS